jgi:hypothetical protein
VRARLELTWCAPVKGCSNAPNTLTDQRTCINLVWPLDAACMKGVKTSVEKLGSAPASSSPSTAHPLAT